MPTRHENKIILPGTKCRGLLADMQSRVAVVVTHPWGQLGGNMHNNIVLAAVRFFQQHNITTLRFDFNGSQIGFGNNQVKQVQEASNYLLKMKNNTGQGQPPSYILLVGYSYGSLISSSASANIPACIGSVSIAPPWSFQHWLLLFNSAHHESQSQRRTNLPRLFVIGDRDNFTSVKHYRKKLAELFPEQEYTASTAVVIEQADHFFAGREKEVMEVIGQWTLKTFPEANDSLTKFGKLQNFTENTGKN